MEAEADRYLRTAFDFRAVHLPDAAPAHLYAHPSLKMPYHRPMQNVIDPKKIMEAAQVRDKNSCAFDFCGRTDCVDVVELEQQNGAVSAAQHEGGRSRAFMGSGYSMQGDSAAPVERNEDKEKIRHTITFWSNGFSVDDGPLRALVCV